MSVVYIIAGINHFISPDIYIKLIPLYIPFRETANYTAGLAEILLGILLIPKSTRNIAAWGIILILITFILAHVYMIQMAPFYMGETLVTPFIAWIRLPLQGLLIYWAWIYTKKTHG